MDIIGSIFGAGVINGLLLSVVLFFSSKGQRLANHYMAGLVLMISLSLLNTWLTRSGFYLEHPEYWLWFPTLNLTWGPFLYLYGVALTQNKVKPIQFLHFLPALILFVVRISVFYDYSSGHQQEFLQYFWSPRSEPELADRVGEHAPNFLMLWVDWHIQGALFGLQFAFYCVLLIIRIRTHNKLLNQHFSYYEEINLKWLKTLTALCLFFIFIYFLLNRQSVFELGYFDSTYLKASLPFVFLVVLIYIIAIVSLTQSDIGAGVQRVIQEESNDSTGPKTSDTPQVQSINVKYIKSSITEHESKDYVDRIYHAMIQDQLFLNCELTLPQLSSHVNLTSHQVSQTLNEVINMNFFTFIARHRIEYTRLLLEKNKYKSMAIIDLALEVGFKSKSSFSIESNNPLESK